VRAQELANVAAEKGRVLTQNGKVRAAELSSKGKQAAADLSAQARDTASDMSGTTIENIRKLPQVGTNGINGAPGIVNSAFGDVNERISTPSSNNVGGNTDGNRSVTGGAANKVSHLSNSASETAKQIVPGINTGKQPDSDHLQNAASSLPAQTGGENTGRLVDTGFRYAVAGDATTTHGILD
jgi:uncharacterized protein YlzI (FlbEa/FlbD family)